MEAWVLNKCPGMVILPDNHWCLAVTDMLRGRLKSLRFDLFNYAAIHDMNYKRRLANRWALFRCFFSRIFCGEPGLRAHHSKRNASYPVWALHSASASSHLIWDTRFGNSCDDAHAFSWTPNDWTPVLPQKGFQWLKSDAPCYAEILFLLHIHDERNFT